MHLDDGASPVAYLTYTRRKVLIIGMGIILLFLLLLFSISVGAVSIPIYDVFLSLIGQQTSAKWAIIIWNIRLPQALTAIVAGVGLSAAGVMMQSILRNPLGSPFTLGISNAAAFGATFAVIILGTGSIHSTAGDAIIINNPGMTTIVAFIFAMIGAFIILGISRIRGASPEVMVLAGVAIGSLFTAGTMFLQYFATDVQLSAVVFWTFGDVSRANWDELGIMALVTVIICGWFFTRVWDLNAIDAGDETARSLGVNVKRLRLVGMIAASFLAATLTALLGVIGFIGLIAPHMVRRLIGDDNRFLLPGSCVAGALVLLASDTTARIILPPHLLPVSILTAFLGAPVFLWLLIRGRS